MAPRIAIILLVAPFRGNCRSGGGACTGWELIAVAQWNRIRTYVMNPYHNVWISSLEEERKLRVVQEARYRREDGLSSWYFNYILVFTSPWIYKRNSNMNRWLWRVSRFASYWISVPNVYRMRAAAANIKSSPASCRAYDDQKRRVTTRGIA